MNIFVETKLTASSPYIDENVLEEFKKFMGDEGDSLARELIELYLKNTPKLMSDIGNDVKIGNMESLKIHVHSLKGSSAQLGVTGIASLCRNIEDVILEGRFVEIKPMVDKLKAVYKEVELNFRERI